MKKITLVLFIALTTITGQRVIAQMAAAKKVSWDVSITADVKASKGDVWRLINNNTMLQRYSNGYVKAVETIDDDTREMTFSNGKKRTETVDQTDHMNKFMVIKINSASLPEGVKNAEIAIFTKDIDDENSSIRWVAKIEGKKSQKQSLIDQLTNEFESYAKGFRNIEN